MDFEGLTEELKAKAQACKTPEELRALAEDMNITLTATKKADIIAEILAAQE